MEKPESYGGMINDGSNDDDGNNDNVAVAACLHDSVAKQPLWLRITYYLGSCNMIITEEINF